VLRVGGSGPGKSCRHWPTPRTADRAAPANAAPQLADPPPHSSQVLNALCFINQAGCCWSRTAGALRPPAAPS